MAKLKHGRSSLNLAIGSHLLPHRPPFRFLDSVSLLKRGESIEAIKNVTCIDCGGFYADECPRLPGMLMLESIAQAGSVLLTASMDLSSQRGLMVMTALDSVSFFGLPIPGDRATITATILSSRNNAAQFSGQFRVGAHLHCTADLLCQIVPRSGQDLSA